MREAIYKVIQGGALVTKASAENVGPRNWVEKTNWRRVDDAEVLREGTVLFKPNAVLAQGSQAFNGGATIRGLWEIVRPNGERAIVLATRTTLHKYVYSTGTWSQIGSGFSSAATYWEGESLDGYLILNNGVDLPVTYRVEDNSVAPITEMREAGIACVGTIAVYNGFLMCGDVTEIASTSMGTWMQGGTPYGTPPPDITNRIRYKVVWSDYGKPRNWAPAVTGTIQSATKNKITLAFPLSAVAVVGAKVAVVGAGTGGGVLGGQSGFDDGMTVTVVDGNEITINGNANSSLTYPLTVEVMRWVDTSSFVGSSSIQDDSSAILRMKGLQNMLVVYRETGIFTGRYTGVVELPFSFRHAHTTRNVPFHRRTLTDLNGESHVYATDNSFYEFDGAGEPRLFAPLDDASDLFFRSVSDTERFFSAHNPITREVWFNSPNGVLAYDYAQRTASWVDESYRAFAFVRKPDGTTGSMGDYWFVMAHDEFLVRYGLVEGGSPVYTRLDAGYWATLKAGLNQLATDEAMRSQHEKDLTGYTLLMSSHSTRADVEITLAGTDHPAFPPEMFEGFPTTVNDPARHSQIDTYFRNVYFQDTIRVFVTPDSPVRLTGRVFQCEDIQAYGHTRR